MILILIESLLLYH